jgi:hypothetical protein
MNRIIIITFFSLIAITSLAQSNSDKDKERIIASCDKFMQTFRDGKYKDAIQMLKQISVIDQSAIDTLTATTNNQMSNITDTYGKINSYEYLGEKAIKDFLVKRTYLLRFDKYYLKFNFTIYKSNLGWTITNFIYNEEIDDLFK